MYPNMCPVMQKKRKMSLNRAKAMQKQVESLLKASFIKEIQYPTWLSNVVKGTKLNGKLWMCVDYTDLNKACLKDPYPLPSIDTFDSSRSWMYTQVTTKYPCIHVTRENCIYYLIGKLLL